MIRVYLGLGVVAALAAALFFAYSAGKSARDLEQAQNTNRVNSEREQINEEVSNDDNLLDRALRGIVRGTD